MSEVEAVDQIAGAEAEGEANPLGILATPEIKLPPREPEVHQAVVLSVLSQDFESGSHALKIMLQSENNGEEKDLLFWIPDAAYENPYISSQEISKLPPKEGKKMTPKEQWGRAKQDIDGLLRIALKQGREIPTDKARPTNFVEYATLIDEVCSGISVVYRAGVEKNAEPQFRNILKVKGLYEPETASNPKLFKGCIKKWETAEPVEGEEPAQA